MDEYDDDYSLNDNDFAITSDVYFTRRNIDQKTVLSQYQILASVKFFAAYKISQHKNDMNYWPIDLLHDIDMYMKSMNLSLNGRGLKMYNSLWNKNTIMSRKKMQKKEKLEYE